MQSLSSAIYRARPAREAARHLGLSEGTVGSRLARARAALAKRLSGRGVTLSGGALAAVLAQNMASAGAPGLVMSNAIKAASLYGAGQAAAAGLVSVKVTALAEGVLQAMVIGKLKAVVAVVLLVAFLGTGATILTRPTSAAPSATSAAPPAEERVKSAQKQQKGKEAFTAWGKEVGGLQAGLGYKSSQQRAYFQGETVRLAVRVRNVSKEAIQVSYHRAFFVETPPAVTDALGKPFRAEQFPRAEKQPAPTRVDLEPGREIELYELKFKLRPDSKDRQFDGEYPFWNTLLPDAFWGVGKVRFQYERLAGPDIDRSLSKLATGKLELDIKSGPPPAANAEAQAAGEPVAENTIVTLKNATIEKVDDATRTISFVFGNKKNPTKLLNIPLAEKVRVVASYRLPGSVNHLPFRWEDVKALQGKVVSVRFIANQLGVLVESIFAGNDAPPQAGKIRPAKVLVWIEKLNLESRSITASCMTIGEISHEIRSQRFENLSISKSARITHKGKDIAFADLKPGAGAILDLNSSEDTFVGTGIDVIREAPPEVFEGSKAWGDPVGGWRMRVTTPSGTEYRARTPLPLSVEVQNVSGASLPIELLAPYAAPEVTADGKRLITRVPIDVTSWEGRRDQLPAGASLKWSVDFNRLRFATEPLKAGTTLRVRFRLATQGKTPDGKPDPRTQRLLLSNEVSLKLQDDHPTLLSGEADLPAQWTRSMVLVYREHLPLLGYDALRIDGDGHAWLVSIGRGKTRPNTRGPIRTEAVLDREHLDGLAKFLREGKLWELPELSQGKIPNPDEGEIRLSIGAGHGSLVGSVPNNTVRGQPKLRALQAEMAKVMALVNGLPPGLEFLRLYPEFHEFRFGQDEKTIRALAKKHSLKLTGTAQAGFAVERKEGARLALSMRDGRCSGIQLLRQD